MMSCHPERSAQRGVEGSREAPAGSVSVGTVRHPSRPRFAEPPCARFACSGVRQSTGLSNAALAQDDEYVSHRDGVDDSFDADAACDLLFASLA